MELTEEQITDALHDFVRDCDADDLAKLAGELFGGKCTTRIVKEEWGYETHYTFEPDENYMGAFGGWLDKLADRIEPELSQD